MNPQTLELSHEEEDAQGQQAFGRGRRVPVRSAQLTPRRLSRRLSRRLFRRCPPAP